MNKHSYVNKYSDIRHSFQKMFTGTLGSGELKCLYYVYRVIKIRDDRVHI